MNHHHAKKRPTKEQFAATVEMFFGKNKAVKDLIEKLGLKTVVSLVDTDTGEVLDNRPETIETKEILSFLNNSKNQKQNTMGKAKSGTAATSKANSEYVNDYESEFFKNGNVVPEPDFSNNPDIVKFDHIGDSIVITDFESTEIDFQNGKGKQKTFIVDLVSGEKATLPTNIQLIKKLEMLDGTEFDKILIKFKGFSTEQQGGGKPKLFDVISLPAKK